MQDGNVLGMIGPLGLLGVGLLNLLLLQGSWRRLRQALLGPDTAGVLVTSRPGGECAVLSFPDVAGGRHPTCAVSLRLAA